MSTPYEQTFALRTLALSLVAWTDVQGLAMLPIDANIVSIVNLSGVDVLLRTDPLNPASQVTVPTGTQFDCGSESFPRSRSFRFPKNGPPVCSLLGTGVGTPSVLIEVMQ